MSSAITETPGTWPTSVTAPDGTDVVSITALRSAMEDINDRVLRTRQSLGMAIVAGAGTSTTRRFDATTMIPLTVGTGTQYTAATTQVGIRQTTASTSAFAAQPIGADLVPNGATLTAITVQINPADGHVAAPGTPPTVALYKALITEIAGAIVDTAASDGTVGGAAYDASHTFSKTGLAEVIDYSTYTYRIIVTGEGGSNAADLLMVLGGTVTYTPPV